MSAPSCADIYRKGIAGPHHPGPFRRGARHPALDERMSRVGPVSGRQHPARPVLVVPTVARRYGGTTTFQQASRWGSILPAVWSFHLALRSRGLGSAWTTLHLYREEEAAELLGIPHDEQTQAGLFPGGLHLGHRLSRRRPQPIEAADRLEPLERLNRRRPGSVPPSMV